MGQASREPLFPAGTPRPGRAADDDCRVRRKQLKNHVGGVAAQAHADLRARLHPVQQGPIALGGK
jgi:hypothetical protein